jgi:hypothetical protein
MVAEKNYVSWVCKRTIPTEQPPLVGKVSVNFFLDRRYHVVSVTDPYGCILGSLDCSCYFCFQVGPQLYSWCWVDPVPDPLLLRKYGSTRNWTWSAIYKIIHGYHDLPASGTVLFAGNNGRNPHSAKFAIPMSLFTSFLRNCTEHIDYWTFFVPHDI